MRIHVLGNGVMAGAMIEALINGKFEVVVVGRNEAKLSKFKELGLQIETYGANYDITGKNIILAFKPHAISDMKQILKGNAQNCISVLAMSKFENLDFIKAKNFALCMPNIAAKFCASITPYIFRGENDGEISQILSSFGKIVRVENYTEFDTAGVISGCAPAFLALTAEAIANGGVKNGLKSVVSRELVSGLFSSIHALLEQKHPAIIKDEICSPGGTTIEGVCVLEQKSVRDAFISAISASVNKSKFK